MTTSYLAISDLIIPEDRQRVELPEDHIKELMDSISSEIGLLHAPVLRNDRKTLVAGECRSAAMRRLHAEGIPFQYEGVPVPPGYIPFTALADLPPDLVVEAELEENIKRRDLPWQQRVAAIAKLASLRERQATASGKKVTQQELATEVLGIPTLTESGTAQKEVRESRLLSEYLDDPDVSKAKTRKDAVKIIEKKKAAEHRAKLAEAFHSETENVRFPHTIYHGRIEDVIQELPSNTYAGIITDPPYGVEADKFGEQAFNVHKYDDSEDYALGLYQLLANEAGRVCLESAHVYTFCEYRFFERIKEMFRAAGWTPWERPMFWFKGSNAGMLPSPDFGPRNTYETILYVRRGGRKTRCVGPDILSIPALSRQDFGAQKPVALYRELASRSFDPGDHVLDTFCGAGPMFRAGRDLSLKVTGIELNKEKIDYIYTTYDEDED